MDSTTPVPAKSRGVTGQAAGLPFSSAATAPAATASRHDATRRASSGVTSPATSSPGTNANPGQLPVREHLLGDLPAARGVRRLLRLHRPARKIPRLLVHRVH